MWEVKYDNDTGPRDGYFDEWWTVTDGKVRFDSWVEADAKRLCELLNQLGVKFSRKDQP